MTFSEFQKEKKIFFCREDSWASQSIDQGEPEHLKRYKHSGTGRYKLDRGLNYSPYAPDAHYYMAKRSVRSKRSADDGSEEQSDQEVFLSMLLKIFRNIFLFFLVDLNDFLKF